ncbi:KIP3 [[Candida] subhashii]|uniref:Kinesin-like protein n=1 Tax=[Candida] subhashii TaxID=561895 RepID=A0A8J5UJN5_9ASCO|nr:KIP3 [[Candida] subhashii]KAG7664713.1 KIP3 [[Candida] subhashii]
MTQSDMNNSRIPESKQSSITVAVRVRPFTDKETNNLIQPNDNNFFLGEGSLTSGETSPSIPSKRSLLTSPIGLRKIINVVDEKMLIFDPPETNPIVKMQRNAFPSANGSRIREHRFVFDRLFDDDATQQDVYCGTTRPLLESVLDGYNATVFAYGATGCGKTHTISGNPGNPGVIFLTMQELYERIDELSDTKIIDVSLSYLEIYNETIKDLLDVSTESRKLVIREDVNQKITVSNLSSHRPNSVEEVMELILQGNKNRTTSPTEANVTSSRSHAVLQINIIQKNRTGDVKEEHTFATLSIIDLAGSERAAATKNRGVRLNEGANINKSLLALGNCINALCDPRRRNHIPYRDSKLTRLLKFSLGGNCKTVMIVCVSPSSQHYDETLNTLKYANRAKEIKTKLIRNQTNLDRHVGSYLKMITEQRQEIDELRQREATIAETAVEKYRAMDRAVYNSFMEAIKSLRASIINHSQEKWKRAFILAKRKLLIIQKVETEVIENEWKFLEQYDKIRDSIELNAVKDLISQLQSKIVSQIPELEFQYAKPNGIDHILNESAMQTLKRLSENQGWSDMHTTLFNQSIQSLKDEVERDILFTSSILYDELINQTGQYHYGIRQLIRGFADDIVHEDWLAGIATCLEKMIQGDFDSDIEEIASAFMKQKLHDQEQQQQQQDDVNSSFEMDSSINNSMMMIDQDEDMQLPIKKVKFDNKPTIKTTTSPPSRGISKRLMKTPITKSSPIRKPKKSVRWDIPKSDSFMDTSMENSINRSDGDISPITTNNILDQLNNEDLAFKFDPILNSPPTNNTTKGFVPKNRKLLTDLRRNRSLQTGSSSSYTNRKLGSFSTPDQQQQPLLNTSAAAKLVTNFISDDCNLLPDEVRTDSSNIANQHSHHLDVVPSPTSPIKTASR